MEGSSLFTNALLELGAAGSCLRAVALQGGKKQQLNRVMLKGGELTGLSLPMINTSHLGKMGSLREYDSLPLNTLPGERTWGPAVQVVPEQERLFFS